MTTTTRVAAGVPAGGQFAASVRDEADVDLYDDGTAEYATEPGRTRQTSEPIAPLRLDISPRRAKGFVELVREGEIDLAPPYQRKSVWSTDQRIELVRSFLTRTPIPAIVINNRRTPGWYEANNTDANRSVEEPGYAVIDGRQRLETMVAWFDGDLAVPASWWPEEEVERTIETPDGEYVTYTGLSPRARLWFNQESTIPVAEGSLHTVAEEAQMYLRLNSAGTAQTDADMDNAARIAHGE